MCGTKAVHESKIGNQKLQLPFTWNENIVCTKKKFNVTYLSAGGQELLYPYLQVLLNGLQIVTLMEAFPTIFTCPDFSVENAKISIKWGLQNYYCHK